jgi:ferredoxin
MLAAAGFNPELHKLIMGFEKGPYRNAPGYTQLDRALNEGGWAPNNFMAFAQQFGQPNSGVLGWKQDHLAETRYKFESKEQASAAIKAAAKLYGSTRAGIARNDPRWNYSEMYDALEKKTLTWDDFPFKPKSVIVTAIEMNYEAISTAPAWVESAAASTIYSQECKVTYSLAVFLRQLGYKAVASVNDLGINAGYAIMAGIGEGARNGSVIAPKIGCRLRLGKVYTDLDFVEYDKPRSYGVMSFCRHCKKCAMNCPSQAISMDDEPGFHPTWSKNPKDWYKNQIGILKFHSNSEKCFRFWC